MDEVSKDTTVILKHDGMEYKLDAGNLNGEEVGVLKRVGHVPGIVGLFEALEAGDLEALIALLGIAMARVGQQPTWGKLMKLTVSDIAVVIPEETKDPTRAGETTTPAIAGDQSSEDSTD